MVLVCEDLARLLDKPVTVPWWNGPGVIWERFSGFPHNEHGIVVTPDGAKVIWFRDPDGNLLSIVQFSR